MAQDDPRVSVIAHSRNCGHIETYNEGIAAASADYFLLLSADDMLVPGALQRAIEVMDANPDVVLTYGDCIAWFDELPAPVIDPTETYPGHVAISLPRCAPRRRTLFRHRQLSLEPMCKRRSAAIGNYCRTPAIWRCGSVSPRMARSLA